MPFSNICVGKSTFLGFFTHNTIFRGLWGKVHIKGRVSKLVWRGSRLCFLWLDCSVVWVRYFHIVPGCLRISSKLSEILNSWTIMPAYMPTWHIEKTLVLDQNIEYFSYLLVYNVASSSWRAFKSSLQESIHGNMYWISPFNLMKALCWCSQKVLLVFYSKLRNAKDTNSFLKARHLPCGQFWGLYDVSERLGFCLMVHQAFMSFEWSH